jgi:A/G-specific adenine glycosylase
MLQQTPVVRVEPVWREWMTRWPRPRDLAAATTADAIRAWGRLGYPRRATRLHKAAQAIVDEHQGAVPRNYAELLALPGVGDYTASAVSSFAFAERHAVLDTNVRRVLARAINGDEYPRSSISTAERRLAETLLPAGGRAAAAWSVAVMELGAVVCTSRSPQCVACPIRAMCTWVSSGSPSYDGPARRVQAWHGTDRQARGCVMTVLREATEPVPKSSIDAVWSDSVQLGRALASLVEDHLVDVTADGHYQLPT